jgi:hypothetical protein
MRNEDFVLHNPTITSKSPCAFTGTDRFPSPAYLDEGLLSLSLPILVCMYNPCSDNK